MSTTSTFQHEIAAGMAFMRSAFSGPWQMEAEQFNSLRERVFSPDIEATLSALAAPAAMQAGLPGSLLQADTWLDLAFGKEPKMEIRDGVAYIPLQGALMRGAPYYMKRIFGLRDTDELIDDLREADGKEEVKRIVLYADTPGGNALGIPEAAQVVDDVGTRKPVFVVVDGLLASAGYFVAASAKRIWAGPSSLVGSLGTFLVAWDFTGYHDDTGRKPTLITNKEGTLKGAGAAGLPLSDEQKAEAQRLVQALNDQFFDFVDRHRLVDPAAKKGQVLEVKSAKRHGLIDSVASASEALASAARARTN